MYSVSVIYDLLVFYVIWFDDIDMQTISFISFSLIYFDCHVAVTGEWLMQVAFEYVGNLKYN